MDPFVIARNPEEGSSLPYLLRVPLGPNGVVLKVRETWPRTAKVYCHPAESWPEQPEVVERVPVRSCVRRGAAIDLVLDRARENRSQFVFAKGRGRDMIFWQSARTAKQARPNVDLPTSRASGLELEILVDTRERYPWAFSAQQANTRRRPLPVGDYAVAGLDGALMAIVERKSLDDLVSTMLGGKLPYLLAELDGIPHAAVVVEHRYSAVFKLRHARPSVIADDLAAAQARFPAVPIVFAETRPLAQEWAYRFLGAALRHHLLAAATDARVDLLPAAGPVPVLEPTVAEVRAWATGHGLDVPSRGRLRPEVWDAFRAATGR